MIKEEESTQWRIDFMGIESINHGRSISTTMSSPRRPEPLHCPETYKGSTSDLGQGPRCSHRPSSS